MTIEVYITDDAENLIDDDTLAYSEFSRVISGYMTDDPYNAVPRRIFWYCDVNGDVHISTIQEKSKLRKEHPYTVEYVGYTSRNGGIPYNKEAEDD